MTDLTKQAIEALRGILACHDPHSEGASKAESDALAALAALEAAQQAGEQQARIDALHCDCGKKLAADCEKWEPGCHLGTDPAHAKAVQLDLQAGEQALPLKTVCPYCDSEWVTGEQHDANLAAYARAAQAAQPLPAPVEAHGACETPRACEYQGCAGKCQSKAPQPLPVRDEREAFEAWCAKAGWKAEYIGDNQYSGATANRWWEAWQARASITQPAPEAAKGVSITVAQINELRERVNTLACLTSKNERNALGAAIKAALSSLLDAAPPAPEAQQADEWETRADGQRVRKDRWQWGIRRIVALLWGNRQQFEIDEVVDAVRALVPMPHVDDEALAHAVQEGAAESPQPAPEAQQAEPNIERALNRALHRGVTFLDESPQPAQAVPLSVIQRVLDAWDTTPLQTNGDGRLCEAIEVLRAHGIGVKLAGGGEGV